MSATSPKPASPSSPYSQRSGYPFPDSRASSSTNRYHPRRASTASQSSLPSIGGSLDIQTRRGSSVRETSQNAISTLLQPPIVRTGLIPTTAAQTAGYRAPTQKDIPPVALTNIEHIPPDNFRDYLQRIGPLFDSFQRGRIEPEQPQWLKKDRELERTDRFAEALERRFSGSHAGQGSPTTPRSSTLSPLEGPAQQRRRASNTSRRNRNEPTPLSTIPQVYFDENFHLENPRTFDIVSERAEIVRPPPGTPQPQHDRKGSNGAPLPPRKALATNAILQEKLSWYMDTVELHLINSISTASTGFFAALGSLKELQSEAEESVAKIQGLRADLRRLDQEVAVGGLEVAAKRRRRANMEKLGRATKQVERVVENVQKADELVDLGSYDEAADQMERVGRLVCGQQSPGTTEEAGEELIDLRPLKALQGLDSGLQELQLRIGTGFANRFTSTLMTDLRQHIDRVPREETLKRWSRQRGIQPRYMETSPDFRQKLLSDLQGLQRARHMAPATAAYREAVNKEMKAIIRKHLPSSSDDDADSMVSVSTRGGGKMNQAEKSTILARNLRSLESEDAEKLLIDVYVGVGEALRRVSTQTKILLDLTSSMEPTSPTPKSNRTSGDRPSFERSRTQEDISQVLDLSSLLEQAVDTAQTQITRVLKVRNEQSIRLPQALFLRYFTLNRLFADECEAVSGRGGTVLKGIINAQISGFVQVLGTSETEKIANLLDSEVWNAVDFGVRDDAVLQRVLASMSSDPGEWMKGRPIWEDVSGQQMANGEPPTANGTSTPQPNGQPTAPATKASTKPAYIDETRYLLVPSAIALLPMIDSFLSLTASMPSMTPQISTSLLDVLRTFNSRSCQLVLGAGATRSAGLKNITTKHLALASQALSFLVALTPYMRECVRRHLAAGQLNVLAEFDKTKRQFQEHQGSIHDKLVEIMTSRSQAHIKAMKSTDFEVQASSDASAKPNAYIETLTKETGTLQRVLARHLSEYDVSAIMRRIFETYREQWTKGYGEVELRSEGARKAMVRDAEVFESKLGGIEGFGDIGKDIVEAVRGKKIVSVGGDDDEEKEKG